jgi:hypothetical protein
MKESDFNLKESLLDVNFYHNNKIYSNTGFKTVEIKDYMDENILNEKLNSFYGKKNYKIMIIYYK